MRLFFQPTGGNAGGSATPPITAASPQVSDATTELYDAAADETLGENWEAELAKEIVGGKKATIRENARKNGVDESEVPELQDADDEGEETDVEETETDETADEGATRADGATWNAEAGRWIKDGKFVAGDPPEGAEGAEEGDETEEGTEGQGAEGEGESAGEGGALLKGLTVLDAEGDEVELPAITVKFKAPNGKEYTQDLKGLARMAGEGVYNHQLQQEVKQAREATGYTRQLEDVVTQYETRDQQYNAYLERLFTDDDFFATEVQAFSVDNTPERKFERAKEQLTRERAQIAQERQAAKADTFLRTSIWPAVEALTKQYPTIKPKELLTEFGALIAPLKVQGRVPLEKLPALVEAIESQLAPWASQIHQVRSRKDAATRTQRDKAGKDAAAREQRQRNETTRLRKIAARAIAPTSGSGARAGAGGGGAGGAKRPPKTAAEGANRALETALASVGA